MDSEEMCCYGNCYDVGNNKHFELLFLFISYSKNFY